MNSYSIPSLCGAVLFAILFAFVFKSRPTTSAKTLFSLLCAETFFWQLIWFVSYYLKDPSQISYIAKLAYIPITFLPFTFYHFIRTFITKKIWSSSVLCFYGIAVVFILILFPTDLYVKGHRSFVWGNFASAGPVYVFFMVAAIASLARGLYILLKSVKQDSEHNFDVNQGRYLLIGMLFYSLCALDFPQVYGATFYPVGTFFFLISFSIISYAITKHNVLDVEVVIRRASVFAGLFAIVYALFSAATIFGQDFFNQTLGWNQWAAILPTVFIITFALRPLDKFLTVITEKYLFQKKYDYRDFLRTFTNEVLTVLDLQQLPNQTVAGLIRILKLEAASIYIHDRDAKIYRQAAAIGTRKNISEFKEEHLLVSYLKASQHPIIKDKVADGIREDSDLKEVFRSLNAQICFPILMHDDLIGILLLGMKKSGEDYTQEDIDILNTLARTEAIAIANAQLFDELSKTQAEAAQREKMAVIGTLAAGINHEICNPLGIVRGQCEMFLLNFRDGFYKEKTQEEMLKISVDIMNKVIKETDRATAITKKLSGFAKPSKRSDLEEVFVEKEVDEVLGLVGHDLKLSNIDVQQDFPQDFPVIFADKKQIQEVLFNIIRNAAQAMDKKQGKIVLSGFRDNGSAIIRIADNGSGIPQDKINQIFNPFYTTKAPGKGTGLGLFIVKQVVERNKGTIAVESEAGIGTTFTLRFPTASAIVAAA